MHHRISGGVWLTLTLALAACGGGTSVSGSASSAPASGSPTPSEASIEPAASGTPLPTVEPSGNSGFACVLPVSGNGTAARANITDVRAGTHDGYDRIVFQFRGGIPKFDIQSATPPFTADPSGQPLTVKGSSFLSITLHGGTKQTETGASSYGGPRNFNLGFPMLVNLVEGGDFEAVSTWYAGLSHAACLRVSTLTAPDRLVIDIQH
ncbi:MAG: hypothetical protein M3R49_12230 [Chloroflexota bacterium]|nr:hypothetical protein [Chloroflexota bacterium]